MLRLLCAAREELLDGFEYVFFEALSEYAVLYARVEVLRLEFTERLACCATFKLFELRLLCDADELGRVVFLERNAAPEHRDELALRRESVVAVELDVLNVEEQVSRERQVGDADAECFAAAE